MFTSLWNIEVHGFVVHHVETIIVDRETVGKYPFSEGHSRLYGSPLHAVADTETRGIGFSQSAPLAGFGAVVAHDSQPLYFTPLPPAQRQRPLPAAWGGF